MNDETVSTNTSNTLLEFLAKLSNELNRTNTAYLIGNIVSSVVQNFTTPLQVALAIIMRDSKTLINQMNKFNVTCSYDEMRRFKKSAALSSIKILAYEQLEMPRLG
ncbi:hypothetical protein ACF0H5_015459 [Mactra antiquata]